MPANLGNSYEEYSELIDALYRFRQKRSRCDNPNFQLATEALKMLCDELGKERACIERGGVKPATRAADSLADVLKAYNELNREEVELDRRDLDAEQMAKMRKRPKGD